MVEAAEARAWAEVVDRDGTAGTKGQVWASEEATEWDPVWVSDRTPVGVSVGEGVAADAVWTKVWARVAGEGSV